MKTNNKQQTPMEWFAEQIRNYKTPLNYGGVYFVFIHQDMINKFEKQAKEMEKERAIKFACDVHMNVKKDKVKSLMQLVDEHYKQTYGGGEQ